MEKAQNLVAVPYKSNWSDLGCWNAVWSESDKDEKGTVTSEAAHAIDCSNTLLRSENEAQQIVGLGLENIFAVAMPDAAALQHSTRGPPAYLKPPGRVPAPCVSPEEQSGQPSALNRHWHQNESDLGEVGRSLVLDVPKTCPKDANFPRPSISLETLSALLTILPMSRKPEFWKPPWDLLSYCLPPP